MNGITEANHLGSGRQLRALLVRLLFMDSMTNPFVIWEATWKLLCDGILYDVRRRLNNTGIQLYILEFLCVEIVLSLVYPHIDYICLQSFILSVAGIQINDNDLKNLCLIEFDKLLYMNGKSLKSYESMPQPTNAEMEQFKHRFLADELNYNMDELAAIHLSLMSTLTSEGFYFLYGYGGT